MPAVLAIVAAIFFKQHFRPVPPSSASASAPGFSAPAAVAASAPGSKPASDEVPLPPPSAFPAAAGPAPAAPRPMTHDDIEAEKDRLTSLQMNNDAESLSNILADLNSPEKEIRLAAIDATVQFNDTNAVPILRARADNTQDPEEKEALLKAADFLALPDVTFSPANSSQPAQN